MHRQKKIPVNSKLYEHEICCGPDQRQSHGKQHIALPRSFQKQRDKEGEHKRNTQLMNEGPQHRIEPVGFIASDKDDMVEQATPCNSFRPRSIEPVAQLINASAIEKLAARYSHAKSNEVRNIDPKNPLDCKGAVIDGLALQKLQRKYETTENKKQHDGFVAGKQGK